MNSVIFIISLTSHSNKSFLVELKSNLQIEVVNLNSEMRVLVHATFPKVSYVADISTTVEADGTARQADYNPKRIINRPILITRF